MATAARHELWGFGTAHVSWNVLLRIEPRRAAHLLLVSIAVGGGLAHGLQGGAGGGSRQGLGGHKGLGGGVPDLLGGVRKEADLHSMLPVSAAEDLPAPALCMPPRFQGPCLRLCSDLSH